VVIEKISADTNVRICFPEKEVVRGTPIQHAAQSSFSLEGSFANVKT
jgi:hypothetical protein